MGTIKTFSSKNQKIWFTSDLHLNHGGIIRYCNRPFEDTHEMDETLIYYWNKYIGKDDIVFILGDFIFGGSEKWEYYISRLNGKKYLCLGNHDEKNFRLGYHKYFEAVEYMMHIKIDDQDIFLSHYPLLCFAGAYSDHPTWNLFGHVHSRQNESLDNINREDVKKILGKDTYRMSFLLPTQYDVGVDHNDFQPVSYYTLKEKLGKAKKITFKTKILTFIYKLLF